MNTKIIKIGNSHGVLIPKSFIHQAKLNKEVQIDLTKDGILIRPKGSMKRKNWREKFRKETRKKQALLLSNFGNDFDKSEWEWK